MHIRRLNKDLQRLHGSRRDAAGTAPRRDHRYELEGRLLTAYRHRQTRQRRWLMLLNPWNRIARFALAGLALSTLGVAACTTSTTTEVELGQKLTFTVPIEAGADLAGIERDVRDLLAAQPGVENVSIGVHEHSAGASELEVLVWGRDVDTRIIELELQREVTARGGVVVAREVLSGSFEESIAAKLGREVLHLEVDGGSIEELRAQILQQIAAQGFDGDAHVDMTTDGNGGTVISITADETVIDPQDGEIESMTLDAKRKDTD